MIRLNPPAIRDAIFVFLVAFACMYVGPAVADELRFSYEFDGSGGCDKDGHAYAAEYRMNRGDLSGHAFVQHKPSGGDCRRNSLNFDVGLEQDFDTGVHGIHAQAKFLAQESATARPYALVIDGAIATRADGNALFETILPAGRAQAIAAILGLSRDCSFGKVEMECDAGFNVVPTDWAAHDEGRTAHFGLTAKWREFDFELKFDVGKENYGDWVLGYEQDIGTGPLKLRVEYREEWGLNTIYDGAPAWQEVAGAGFLAVGAPQDRARSGTIGITWEL